MTPCSQLERLKLMEKEIKDVAKDIGIVRVKNGNGMEWEVSRSQFDQKIYDLAKSVEDIKTFLSVGKKFKMGITEIVVILMFLWQLLSPYIKH